MFFDTVFIKVKVIEGSLVDNNECISIIQAFYWSEVISFYLILSLSWTRVKDNNFCHLQIIVSESIKLVMIRTVIDTIKLFSIVSNIELSTASWTKIVLNNTITTTELKGDEWFWVGESCWHLVLEIQTFRKVGEMLWWGTWWVCLPEWEVHGVVI